LLAGYALKEVFLYRQPGPTTEMGMKYLKLYMLLLALITGLVTIQTSAAQAGQVRVVASIQPLALIAAALLSDDGMDSEKLSNEVSLERLMNSTGSPHGYALRPSEMRRLYDADVILWVGPALESYLIKAMSNASEQNTIITAMDLVSLRHVGFVEKKLELSNNDQSDQVHNAHHNHNESIDPHLWLDPENALPIARALVDAVVVKQPHLAKALEQRFVNFSQQIKQLDHELSAQLNPLSEKHFVVFHDAYGYLLSRYQLTNYRAFTINPERKPGAKTLFALHQYMDDNKVNCVFSEPQFSTANASLVRGGGRRMRRGVIDPLGSNFKLGNTAYVQMLASIGRDISTCLSQ